MRRGARNSERRRATAACLAALLMVMILGGCQGGSPGANAARGTAPAAAPAGATNPAVLAAYGTATAETDLQASAPRPLAAMTGTPGSVARGAPAPAETSTSPGPTATIQPPTATATPTARPSPTSTPVPAPRRLTSGGCCWNPFLLDGEIAFMDRPSQNAQTGYYAVPLGGGDPRLVENRSGFFLNGGAYFSYQDKGETVIERRQDGKRWALNTNGQPVVLSPDGSQAAWSVRDWEGAYDQRRSQLWRASLDGGKAQQVISLFGGGLSAWLPGDRWLLTGRRAIGEADRSLSVYDLKTGQSTDLFKAQGFRSLSVSPDGAWALLVVALDPKTERNGTWLVPLGGGEPRKLDWFGAFAWRDANSLYYLPFQAETASNEVWLYDVASNAARRLTDPAVTQFKIAQGDFLFVPGSKSLVYVSASDNNLWVLPLPE